MLEFRKEALSAARNMIYLHFSNSGFLFTMHCMEMKKHECIIEFGRAMEKGGVND